MAPLDKLIAQLEAAELAVEVPDGGEIGSVCACQDVKARRQAELLVDPSGLSRRFGEEVVEAQSNDMHRCLSL